MQYANIHGYTISKLTLGTVALGMNYGIANKSGKPPLEESLELLSFALESGINTFDTAATYGSAEQLTGAFLADQGKPATINTVTKFKISPENIYDIDKARAEVFASVRSSLRLLGLKKIPVCLLHMSRELPMEAIAKVLPSIFEDLQHEQLIDLAGVSIDHPAEAEWFAAQPFIQALQIPINVFDQRLIDNGALAHMKASGKIIFARSVFLQGLFFLTPDELKGNLVNAAAYLHQLKLLAAGERMSIAQFVFSYIRDMDGITSIVFGAENKQQVAQNIDLLEGGSISVAARAAASRAFAAVPEDIITPANWSS
ncbi:aldo/keto reductase [Chitinophaga sp. MM2321]|uniref:aldo/keto reductase n=1 Tax=Chitinophaga sp. MM2321 TaxID=3137178 RepID=UPI0032D580D1